MTAYKHKKVVMAYGMIMKALMYTEKCNIENSHIVLFYKNNPLLIELSKTILAIFPPLQINPHLNQLISSNSLPRISGKRLWVICLILSGFISSG